MAVDPPPSLHRGKAQSGSVARFSWATQSNQIDKPVIGGVAITSAITMPAEKRGERAAPGSPKSHGWACEGLIAPLTTARNPSTQAGRELVADRARQAGTAGRPEAGRA